MTKRARITNRNLSYSKRAAAPKVRTWITIFKDGPIVNVVLIGALLAVGFSYLGIVNSTAADTVRLNQLSTIIDTTTKSNQDLELDITEVLSLQHVDEMSQRYELVSATEVEYIESYDPAVALYQQ